VQNAGYRGWTVQEKHLVARGRQITIRTEPGNVRLFIDDEEIRIRHHQGEKPFSTPYLPHVHYDSVETLAKSLVQHRFPGGAR
jgi:hypothetical protein